MSSQAQLAALLPLNSVIIAGARPNILNWISSGKRARAPRRSVWNANNRAERERRSNIKSRGYASAPPGAFGGLPFSFSLVLRLFQRGDEKEGLDDVVAEKPAVRRIKGQKMMRGEKERRQRADIRIVSGHLAESADLHFAFAAPRDASERIYRSHLSIFISLALCGPISAWCACSSLSLSLSFLRLSRSFIFLSPSALYAPYRLVCRARSAVFFFVFPSLKLKPHPPLPLLPLPPYILYIPLVAGRIHIYIYACIPVLLFLILDY